MLKEYRQAQPSVGRTIGLVVGDALIFALFVVLGRRSHSEGVTLSEIIHVAAPFAIGWFAVAPWFKLYNYDVSGSPKLAMKQTALAWCFAAPIGLALRTFAWGKAFMPTFAITTFLVNLVLLVVWRGFVARRFVSASK